MSKADCRIFNPVRSVRIAILTEPQLLRYDRNRDHPSTIQFSWKIYGSIVLLESPSHKELSKSKSTSIVAITEMRHALWQFPIRVKVSFFTR